jgi:hypothetical protein
MLIRHLKELVDAGILVRHDTGDGATLRALLDLRVRQDPQPSTADPLRLGQKAHGALAFSSSRDGVTPRFVIGDGYAMYRGSTPTGSLHRHAAFQIVIGVDEVVAVVDAEGTRFQSTALVITPMERHRLLDTADAVIFFVEPHPPAPAATLKILCHNRRRRSHRQASATRTSRRVPATGARGSVRRRGRTGWSGRTGPSPGYKSVDS